MMSPFKSLRKLDLRRDTWPTAWRFSVFIPYPLRLLMSLWKRMQPLNSEPLYDGDIVREALYWFFWERREQIRSFLSKNHFEDKELILNFLDNPLGESD